MYVQFAQFLEDLQDQLPPARIEAASAAEFFADTPNTRVLGSAFFKAAPTPLIRPPPPMEMKMLSIWSVCPSNSSPIVP